MKKHSDSLWKVMLVMLCLVIAVLTVGIIITKNLDQKPGEHKNEVESSLIEQAQADVSALDGIDIPAAIQIYQTYIDMADDETKIELYKERIRFILDNDIENNFKPQVINDYVAIDDILQTINSAIDIINILYFYKDYSELFDKYNHLLKEREAAEQIDTNMETVG